MSYKSAIIQKLSNLKRIWSPEKNFHRLENATVRDQLKVVADWRPDVGRLVMNDEDEEVKICRQCKHYCAESVDPNILKITGSSKTISENCIHPEATKLEIDLVTGDEFIPVKLCVDERSYRGDCGVEGIRWEPRQ